MLYTPQGNFCSKLIFWELNSPSNRKKYPPLWTLKQEMHQGLPSAYKVYMSCTDETEAAIKLTGNMKNWRTLLEGGWFVDGDRAHGHEGLTVWREDMKARDASLAKKLLIEQTNKGNTTAARALLAESKIKSKAGRKGKKAQKQDVATVSRISEFKKNKVTS